MPNNGFNGANRANTHLDEENTRRTRRGAADDISGAATEDLVAIFGGKPGDGEPKADPLDEFDDSPSHGKPGRPSAKTDSRRRDAGHTVDRAKRDGRNGSGTMARGKSTNGAEHIRNSDGDRKAASPDKKAKAAKIIAISLLSVIAVGGI